MTLTLTASQIAERCTVTVVVTSAASLFYVYAIIDGKAYSCSLTPYTPNIFTYDLSLERGPHIIYGQVTDSVGTVTTAPITYVMAYELTEYGIDVYADDAKLDVIEPLLHDALLPDLPTLNFSCATLLTGTIQAVIRERGLRKYQFTIATVGISGPSYSYTCKAAESYALTSAIMVLQTAYGSTADAIKLIVPSLNIVNASLLAQTTYPQLFANITPTEIIKQLMIQALAQASARNGNLYVFPLDVSAQVPDYHMQRLDPLTGWQRDADVYDAVVAHYLVKQFPNPSTVLTLNDATNWTGTVTDVTQVDTTLLPVPSGALGMLKSVGNASRAVSTLFKYFDRVRFNWCPVPTGATVTVSLQQDVNNKLELTHTFAGQMGAGFVQHGSPGVPTDTVTETIVLSSPQFVTTVTGTTTARCSYRVTLLNAGGGTIWQNAWSSTSNNAFEANVPMNVSQAHQATTVRIEFTDLYLIGEDYGVQAITCDIAVQTWTNVGSHQQIDSNVRYSVPMGVTRIDAVMTWTNVGSHTHVISSTVYQLTYVWFGPPTSNYYSQGISIDTPLAGQWYTYAFSPVQWSGQQPYLYEAGGSVYGTFGNGIEDWNTQTGTMTATLNETVQDWAWVQTSPSNDYTMETTICPVPSLTGIQIYTATVEMAQMISNQQNLDLGGDVFASGGYLKWYEPFTADPPERIGNSWVSINVVISETVQDYTWISSLFAWSPVFNLFETVDISFADMTRTGNPVNLQTIALTFANDNYVDTLCLVADNPLPVTVQAGTGSRAYVVTDDFGSEAGAQAYADGLLPIVSVAREQYTRDVSLATDLSVGDTISGDGVPMTVYAVDYRQSGKTLAAGRAMDVLMTRLAEQARRIGALERKA